MILFGIKGQTVISQILDLPTQVPFDYMHLVLQGHVKWLLKAYMYGDKREDYYIGEIFLI
jgi:hypothetical protein